MIYTPQTFVDLVVRGLKDSYQRDTDGLELVELPSANRCPSKAQSMKFSRLFRVGDNSRGINYEVGIIKQADFNTTPATVQDVLVTDPLIKVSGFFIRDCHRRTEMRGYEDVMRRYFIQIESDDFITITSVFDSSLPRGKKSDLIGQSLEEEISRLTISRWLRS